MEHDFVCEYCGLKATHVDSVPDPKKAGYSASECGYRNLYLCRVHAEEHKKIHTNVVESIEGYDNEERWFTNDD